MMFGYLLQPKDGGKIADDVLSSAITNSILKMHLSTKRMVTIMDGDYNSIPFRKILKSKRKYIICGDWNIAHKEIDIKNWKANQKNSGFLPEERKWIDRIINHYGCIDAFRNINKDPHNYTWWSNRGRAWDNNVGWRIDYQMLSSTKNIKVLAANIYKKERFSDHSPLIIDYDI